MKKLRMIFYYTTTGLALGYLINLLLYFSTAFEMMVGLDQVLYIFTAFGFIVALSKKRLDWKYSYFIIVGIATIIALLTGRLIQLLYITREALHATMPVAHLMPWFIGGAILATLLNLYIIYTLPKYQKEYTKEEKAILKKEEVHLSELREKKSEREIQEIKKKRKKGRIIVLVGITLFFLVYGFVEPFRIGLNQAFATISRLDTQIVINYLRSFGPLAAVVSFILMVLQSVAAPIPAFLITLSNAAIFGWWQGAILSWASAMAGAALCFVIARYLGRDVVEKLTSKGAMESVDVFFEKYGKYTILICRLLPFVSFDFVSYAAGLTNMSFLSFFVATGVGQLPATIVYSYVGGTLTGGAQKLFVGLLTLFGLSLMIGIAKKMYNDKQAAKGKKIDRETAK